MAWLDMCWACEPNKKPTGPDRTENRVTSADTGIETKRYNKINDYGLHDLFKVTQGRWGKKTRKVSTACSKKSSCEDAH